MRTKNTFLRMAVALLAVASLCACLFAGNTTLAKYTAAASGTATVDVAKWSILVREVGAVDDVAFTDWTEIAETANVKKTNLTLGLFETIKDTNTNMGPENHVAGDPDFLAPGTMGSFGDLAICNASDVNVDIFVELKLVVDEDVPTAIATLLKSRIKFVTDTATPTTFVTLGTGDKVLYKYANVAAGALASTVTPAIVNSIGSAVPAGWIWSFLDTQVGAGSDPLGLVAAGVLPDLANTGYKDDNQIGDWARLNAALAAQAISFEVSIYAVQVD